MPFTEEEIASHYVTIEKVFWSKRRPPLHLRDKVREGQRIEDSSIELFTVRPLFRKPEEYYDDFIAKIRFIRGRKVWQLYWMRASGKWEKYPHHPEAPSLEEALTVIHEDAYCCFFG